MFNVQCSKCKAGRNIPDMGRLCREGVFKPNRLGSNGFGLVSLVLFHRHENFVPYKVKNKYFKLYGWLSVFLFTQNFSTFAINDIRNINYAQPKP